MSVFQFKNKNLLNSDFLFQPIEDQFFSPFDYNETYDDSKSMAKEGQTFILDKHLSKNVLFIVMKYLNCEEMIRFKIISKKMSEKLANDPYIH